jgi:hypothetical protein
MKSDGTLVTIFPGPVPYFRVRELASPGCQVQTLLWTGNYENAVDYIREHYNEEQAVSPDDFRREVRKCRGAP